MQALAEPAGICISGTAFDQVEGKLPLQFKFIGEQQVKNIPKPVRAYKALADTPVGRTGYAQGGKRRTLAISAAVLVAMFVVLGIVWKIQHPDAKFSLQTRDPVLAVPTGPAIAVLAFENMGGDPTQDFFGDGIAEEIISGLSRFPNLKVLARNSTFQFKGKSVDVREIGRQLGAAYVVEGSVRRAAGNVRVTVQLLDASNATHIWAETYERNLTPKNLFTVQDEITSQVVTRIGDVHGAVNQARIQQVRAKAPASLEDYECVLLAYEYQRFLTPDKHANVKACLVRTVERSPYYADAWANLAYIYADQYWGEYEGPPNPLGLAHAAATRAVELDPTSPIARFSLANVHFFENDLEGFSAEAEKALALNPNNTEIMASLAVRFCGVEKRERGLALIKKAMALNPHHPGWYWNVVIYNLYEDREYERGLEVAKRVDMPTFYWTHLWLTVLYAQNNQLGPARIELSETIKFNQKFGHEPLKYLRQWLKSEKALQHMLQGLRKTGLPIADERL